MRVARASLLMTAIVGLLVGSSSVLNAGYRGEVPVVVDADRRYASGSVGSVRASGDGEQYIGCTITAQSGTSQHGACTASNAEGFTRSCFVGSGNTAMLGVISGLNGQSLITFE